MANFHCHFYKVNSGWIDLNFQQMLASLNFRLAIFYDVIVQWRNFNFFVYFENFHEVPESPRNWRTFRDATVNVRNKHIFSWVWHTFTLSLSHMIGFVRFRRSSGLLDLVLFSQDHESDQRVFQLTKQILAVIDKTYLSEPKIGFKNCTLYFIWYIIWNLISY